ncbi:MAG TPA: 2-succinyl-5-enolpyruvyl-6-hydroxy-3-cyclohexene-1-carboxylic-acid synthase [Bacteroidales bacterium]|nr:2-succinyl-5-enolpyruvyl-6-hydroxy-3-cyclohexene-1-carboxylic-acid synthase [Bacteroidales bacterium]
MFSSKKNVLETVALFKAHGISEVVLSPGSRNAPLIQTFASDPFFNCHTVVDERSAGFFALGIINRIQKPVAVCCTSGTALLNFGPAVAEAFYQELPLVVLSADRSGAWIGQMDGQTLPQPGVFGSLVKKSVQLPEIQGKEDLWHCNRLVNEALNAAVGGPVHINLPISEPLFDFSVELLPEVRKTTSINPLTINNLQPFVEEYEQTENVLILIGQLPPISVKLKRLIEKFRMQNEAVVLVEHLGSYQSSDNIGNFDALISTWDAQTANEFVPDLLITMGGHVVSKRVKKWLRENPAKAHWHIGLNGQPDTYCQATHFFQTTPEAFLEAFNRLIKPKVLQVTGPWTLRWILASKDLPEPSREFPFSDMTVTGLFLKSILKKSVLFTGNSSPVRNLQLYRLPYELPVFCNRGTSGIEGTLSSACGYATVSDSLVYVLIGDLSFFYDLNILTHQPFPKNLRIMLINNGGGAIFKQLPGLERSDIVNNYISASHHTKAKGFVEASGVRYLHATNYNELDKAIKVLRHSEGDSAVLLEVFTDEDLNLEAIQNYNQALKNRF